MAEAKNVAAVAFCGQLLWILQQIHDLGINLKHVPIKCESAINIIKNPIQHSHTKNIEIRHHFI